MGDNPRSYIWLALSAQLDFTAVGKRLIIFPNLSKEFNLDSFPSSLDHIKQVSISRESCDNFSLSFNLMIGPLTTLSKNAFDTTWDRPKFFFKISLALR